MPDNIKIEIKNQNLVLNYIKRFPKEVRTEIYKVVEEELNAAATSAKAIANASRFSGDLADKIEVVRTKEVIEYRSLSAHAAFAEFGTRGEVRPTQRYQKIAAKFKGLNNKPDGKSAKQSIYEWAAYRGISKQFWYPIFRKIIGKPINASTTGTRPINNGQGYFFLNLDIAIKNILKRSEEVIKKAIK